jgi:hypothetical protein
MNRKALSLFAAVAFSAISSMAQSQTAQSAMVDLQLGHASYQIEGTITWTYDRDAAETFYSNAWDGNAPVVTVGSGAVQTSPGPDAPSGVALQNHAQQERCTFFLGGDLTGTTYTQTVNGTKGWKWTYTYNITPNLEPATVAAKTAWTSEETGGTVDVTFDGFVASESYLKQAKTTKYSFTLLDGNLLSRVQNVSAQLQKLDDLLNWVSVGDPVLLGTLGTLDVTAASEDFPYFGNAGFFGNSLVYSSLHTTGYLSASPVSAILTSDSFLNNNNDLISGNVHQALYGSNFPGISEAGSYQVVVSGTIKGNSASASVSFTVASEVLVIGGCTQ